jgi:hypothetical protein
MSTDVTLTEPRSLDEFEDWTDEAESGEEQVSERSILGQRVRFANEGKWVLPGQVELKKPLIAVNVRRSVIKWGKDKKKPPETIFLKAGEKIPDLKKKNEDTPKSEWIIGFDGKTERALGRAAHCVLDRSDQHRSVHVSYVHYRRGHRCS